MSAPTDDVVDRLRRLAAHAPVAGVDPETLWRRGRRRQRRRTASALAVVAAGVIVSVATPTALARLDPPVVASSSQMVLPDVLRTPGGWEPAFPPAPGRLSAVGVGNRSGWTSSSLSAWGVSATTGNTRWLDLPDLAAGSGVPPQLSADGRQLAYWVTGEISGEPVSAGPRRVGTEGPPVVGVAVMDLDSGEVSRWDTPSDHGLWVRGLRWAGNVLWWEAGAVIPQEDGVISASTHTHTWDVTADERMEAGVMPSLSQAGDAPSGFVTLPRSFRLEQVTGAGDPLSRRVGLPDGALSSGVLLDPEMAPDGERVAALLLADGGEYDAGDDHDLVVGAKDGSIFAAEPVGDVRAQAVRGWRSPTEVVVSSWTGTDDGVVSTQQTSVVDVTTGARTDLLEVVGSGPDSVAAQAWAGDVVAAPPAPFAPDPRLAGAGTVVVLAFCISLFRDIRGRRGHP